MAATVRLRSTSNDAVSAVSVIRSTTRMTEQRALVAEPARGLATLALGSDAW
jgi:hypothetical protein